MRSSSSSSIRAVHLYNMYTIQRDAATYSCSMAEFNGFWRVWQMKTTFVTLFQFVGAEFYGDTPVTIWILRRYFWRCTLIIILVAEPTSSVRSVCLCTLCPSHSHNSSVTDRNWVCQAMLILRNLHLDTREKAYYLHWSVFGRIHIQIYLLIYIIWVKMFCCTRWNVATTANRLSSYGESTQTLWEQCARVNLLLLARNDATGHPQCVRAQFEIGINMIEYNFMRFDTQT